MNKMTGNLAATIKLNPDDLLIALNQKLSESTNAVFFGVNALELTKELPESISDGENSIFVHKPIGKISLSDSKINFKNWILKKGFEDLIIALTELLISFCIIIDLNEKVKLKEKATMKELLKIIGEPNHGNSKDYFPSLLAKVNSSLKSPLRFVEEVKTINRVRRCLVHRNGIVRPNDFNTKGNNGIELKWWFYDFHKTEINKQKEHLNRFDLITNETKLEINEIQKTKFFKENERIIIDFQEFNELVLFCQRFGYDILEKFKLADITK